MKRLKIIPFLLIFVMLLQLLSFPAAAQDPAMELRCRNAILMDAESGQILFTQDAYSKAFPASMTKVMTALLVLEALEDGSLTTDTMLTISERASTKENVDESSAELVAGEQMSVHDMMYCLLLPSANDAARAFAEYLAGSVEAFVDLMNQRATELGCKSTHYTNVTGLHNPNHYSCAYDMAVIFREAMTHPFFLQISGTAEYFTAPTNMYGERRLVSTNSMLSDETYIAYLYEYCIAGKTGSTDEAGKCLTSAAKKDDKVLISVVMGSGPYEAEDGSIHHGHYTESLRLLEYGFENFHRETLTQPATAVASVAVTMSDDGTEVGVVPVGSIPVLLSKDITQADIQTQITLFEETIEAPVTEGQVMGSMRLYYGDQTFGELELVAERGLTFSEEQLKQLNRRAFWAKNWGWFVFIPLLILLLPVAALFAIRYINIYRAKRRRMRRQAARAAAQRKARNK